MKHKLLVWKLLALLALVSAAHAQSGTVTVSAAASLKEVLTDLGRQYEKTRANRKVSFNFGASGTLQRQIENGAPVDVFIAAATKNMDELAARKLIQPSTRRVLAGNILVLIVPRQSTFHRLSFRQLARSDVRHVAIGAPRAVPAGKYAQQVLSRLGIWTQVQSKAVQCKDVREVLTQVGLGNVDAGIVYRTDALLSPKVRVTAIAPASLHQPIRYPIAMIANSSNGAAARDFIGFLGSRNARLVLRRYGFLTP
jgi:molybdate transport system substrate-binding protein